MVSPSISTPENPNLADFRREGHWEFINAMLGEGVFERAPGKPTQAALDIKPSADPVTIEAAARKIHGQSERLVDIFNDENSLRARLREIVRSKVNDLAPEQVDRLLEKAKAVALGAGKEREAQAGELQESILAALQQSTSAAAGAPPSPRWRPRFSTPSSRAWRPLPCSPSTKPPLWRRCNPLRAVRRPALAGKS